jgi:hypothetical protein
MMGIGGAGDRTCDPRGVLLLSYAPTLVAPAFTDHSAASSPKSIKGFGGWRCMLQSQLAHSLAFLGLHVDLAPHDKSDLA